MLGENIRTYSENSALIAQKREYIAECAVQLFTANGFEHTSVRQIAKACKMSVGALYYYVGSKEDILALVINIGLNAWANWVNETEFMIQGNVSAKEALKKAFGLIMELEERTQDLTVFMYHDAVNLQPNALQRTLYEETKIIEVFNKILTKGVELGEFQITDTRLAALNITMIAETWAIKRWFLRKKYSMEDYIAKQVEYILRAANNEP